MTSAPTSQSNLDQTTSVLAATTAGRVTTGSDDISTTGDVTTTTTSTVGTTGMQAEASSTTHTREMTSESEPITTELEAAQPSTAQEQEVTQFVVTSWSSVKTSTSQPEVGETTSAERGDATDYPSGWDSYGYSMVEGGRWQ